MKTIRALPVLPALVLVSIQLAGCASEESKHAKALVREFEAVCPQPKWWDQVSVKAQVDTFDDLLTYWQDRTRTKNQFFKAAYQAVLDHPLDDDVVVLALSLMPYGDSAYAYVAEMYEFALSHYSDYQRPVHNYSGKPGDTIGGVVQKLAKIYNRRDEGAAALEIIEPLLREREAEINDHILEGIALQRAEALAQVGRGYDAIAILEDAIERYHGDWEDSLREKLNEVIEVGR